MISTGQIWGIFEAPDRKIRITLQTNNDIVFVHLKMIVSGKKSTSILMTLSEFSLIPIADILEEKRCEEGSTWAVYNGRRKLLVSLDRMSCRVTISLNKIKELGEWRQMDELYLSWNEFKVFESFIPDIMQSVQYRVITKTPKIKLLLCECGKEKTPISLQ